MAGISGYGNSVGVPTVGGELTFDRCYAQNPLVNVLCMGVLPIERLVLGPGLRGGEPGRAARARPPGGTGSAGSACWPRPASGAADAEAEAAKRPSVQVGDPYEEKRLIEACLELLDAKLVVGIQDLGGAGLVCATSETAARGGVGMDVDVSAVPRREPGMAPYEVMTSESQERMLAIVTPDDLARVEEVCRRWEVRAAVVGRVTEPAGGQPGRLRILDGFDGEVLGDVPAVALSEDAPLYHRPLARPGDHEARAADDPGALPAPADCGADILALLADPSWVYRQYDHQLFLNTVDGPGRRRRRAPPGRTRPAPLGQGPGPHHRLQSRPGARSTPGPGTAATVAEGALNVACAGARPMAVVNCLNFGNPEHPEVMWQLSEAIDGMSEACLALGLPVIGGNVSLYNESDGVDIDPTPVIGVLGLIDRLAARPPGVTLVEGASLVLLDASVGATAGRRSPPSLAGSRWAVECPGPPQRHPAGPRPGRPPPPGRVRAPAWWREGVAGPVGRLTGPRLVSGIHDVSGGGLGVALAEMAVRSGVGLRVAGVADHHELFTEAPSRVVVCTTRPRRAGRPGRRGRRGLPGAGHRRGGPDGGRGPGRPRAGRGHRGVAGPAAACSTSWPPVAN